MDPLTKKILSRAGLVHSNLLLPPVHGVGIVYLQEPLKDAEIHLHSARKALYSLEQAKRSNVDKNEIDGLEDLLKDAMVKLEKSERRHFKDRFGNGCVSGWCSAEKDEGESGDDDDDENDYGGASFLNPDVYPSGWNLNEEVDTVVNASSNDTRFVFKHERVADSKEITENFRDEHLERFKENGLYFNTNIDAYMALLGGSGNPGSAKNLFMETSLITRFLGEENEEFKDRSAKDRHEKVRRATAGLDTLGKQGIENIYIPINVNDNHWIMIQVDLNEKEILSMDSLGNSNVTWKSAVLDWLEAEFKSKSESFDRENWKLFTIGSPQQQNRFDCGVFACMFAAYKSNDLVVTKAFDQEYIDKMRKAVAWSIMNQTLEVP